MKTRSLKEVLSLLAILVLVFSFIPGAPAESLTPVAPAAEVNRFLSSPNPPFEVATSTPTPVSAAITASTAPAQNHITQPTAPTIYLADLNDLTKIRDALKNLPSPPESKPSGPGSTEITQGAFDKYTDQQKRDYLIKKRDQILDHDIPEILNYYKEKKAAAQTYTQINTKLTEAGLEPTDKKREQILQRYREATKEQQTALLYDSSTKNKVYSSLAPAQQAFFGTEEVYKTALSDFQAARANLVTLSAGMFDAKVDVIQVWDAQSWEKLTPAQKGYFGGEGNRAEFLQAQRNFAQTAKISKEENDYLIQRQEYISQSIGLADLKNKRASAKPTEEKAVLESDIASKQKSVDEAYTAYVKLQPKALGEAYKRQASELKTQIEQLDSKIQGMDPGPERRKLENQVAGLMGQQRIAAFKARDALNELTFVEKLNEFVKAYSEFSGLGQYSSLFISDKDLAKRRKEAEDAFCDTVLLGGTNCWASKICEDNIDATIGGTGVVASTVTGEPRGAARIQADKSTPAIIHNETLNADVAIILYHVEYFITNTNEEPLQYNLVFHSTAGQTVRAFGKDKELAPGATESRLRTSGIARYSGKDYLSVCLTLNPGIPRFTGGIVHEVCTGINSNQGGPTLIATPGEAQAGTTAGQPRDFEGF